jgi:hypothetical protein
VGDESRMKFKIVYEPRVEDPVVVAEFTAQAEAEAYMNKLRLKRPQTYKFTSIVVAK